ncbi:MAG: hypothetical protein IJI14_02975, partial [Anaerolineaceae bacterium]|nr:hypothetical protein [Anaerolineaceae bacterium]
MAFPFFMMFSRKLNFHEKLMPEYLVQFQMLRQKNCIGKIENIISLLKGLFIMGQWVYIEDIDENDSRENVEEQIAELQTQGEAAFPHPLPALRQWRLRPHVCCHKRAEE